MSASNDDSESVDQFLARIASLSRKNEEQDDGQARKMEEDMMQARKERQARRAGTFPNPLPITSIRCETDVGQNVHDRYLL